MYFRGLHKTAIFAILISKMLKLKNNQRGLITMELVLLIVMAVVIYLVYKKVQSAQQ